MPPKYKLKLKRLDFISPVDSPAQETAKVLLIKRKDGRPTIDGIARVVKVEEGLGLVFCWAFTSKAAGTEYYDLHGDTIDEDFIKAAAEFMQSGGVTDEMHDSQPDGRVVFAMPMTAEVAKAFGVTTDTFGLMVALKPSADVLEKFKNGEYTGVSIAGLGERIQLSAKRELVAGRVMQTSSSLPIVMKRGLLTSAEEGHSHLLDDGDGAGAGYTSCECMGEGESATYHSHPWSRNDAGAIVIGMSAGHAHTVLNPASAGEATTESDVAMRARDNKSPPSTAAPSVKAATTSPTETTMDPKLLALLTAALSMPDAHRAHVSKMAPADAATFLDKPLAERESIVKAAGDADPIVYTTKSGLPIHKSDGNVALQLAQAQDASAEQIAKANDALAKATATAEQATFEKRGDAELGTLFGKSAQTRAAVVKAIDGIADEALRKDAQTSLAGAKYALEMFAKATGANPGATPTAESPLAKFNTALATFAKAAGKTPQQATADFMHTPEGAELYAAFRTQAA